MVSGPTPRRYDSSRRRAAAAASQARVLQAAHDLFVERGFVPTAITDIAARAGVSAPTVYSSFGSKAGILKRAIDVAIAGDESDVAVPDRPLAQWVEDAGTAEELLDRYATMMGEIGARSAPLYDVLTRAADSVPELAELLADFERQRLAAADRIAKAVARRTSLPRGLTRARLRDVIWLYNAPEQYVALVTKRGWSVRQYVAWASAALRALLVEPPAAG